ncbi:hypothetical protein AXW74_01875 [Sphingobium sp. AM]|nr:hypothetical protein AXW74_01875 [Sphingobium sp. AM]
MVDSETRPSIALSGHVGGTEALRIIIVGEHQDLDMIRDDQLIKSARAEGRPAGNVAQQCEGAGVFEAFGNPQNPARISTLPRTVPGRSQHRLVCVVSRFRVEEYSLNRRQLPSLANCDQQSG